MTNKKKQAELFYTPKRMNGDLAVYQYGHHKCPSSHFYGPTKRAYYLFHFIVKGRGIYKYGDKEFSLEQGTGFLIRPGEETFYQADETEPWEYYFVAFNGSIASGIVDEIAWEDGCIFYAEDEEAVKRCMRNICREKNVYVWSEFKVLGELYVLLAELMRQRSSQNELGGSEKTKSELEKVIAYIKENAASPECNVEKIAQHINMHRASLYRLFKKKFGISVKEYLQNYRLDQAAALLQSTDLAAKEIAVEVGIPDYPHFCKCFKEHNGYSPLEYRKRFQKKQKNKGID